MTDKEVSKLRRADLIEILYYLSRENDRLQEENEQLKARLDALVGEAIAAKKQSADKTTDSAKKESSPADASE